MPYSFLMKILFIISLSKQNALSLINQSVKKFIEKKKILPY